jgi:hypothetical protein
MPAHCAPNADWQKRIAQLTMRAQRVLDERAGDVACGQAEHVHGGIKESELMELVAEEKSVVGDYDFKSMWAVAMQDLKRRVDEVEVGNSYDPILVSLHPYKPIVCRIRQSIYHLIMEYIVHISAILSLAAGYLYIKNRLASNKQQRAQVAELVQQALHHLAEQVRLYQMDPKQYPDKAIAVAHLRDVVLHDVHDALARNRIWNKVQSIVETNSNVRASNGEMYGEPVRLWEWIGGILASPLQSPQQLKQKLMLYPEMEAEEEDALQSPVRSGRVKGKKIRF